MGLFPRLKGRGPIEAAASSANLASVHTFPRLKGRGPIEARLRQCVVPGFNSYFRG